MTREIKTIGKEQEREQRNMCKEVDGVEAQNVCIIKTVIIGKSKSLR